MSTNLIFKTLTIVLSIIVYALSSNDDVDISEPLAEFISTASKLVKDKNLGLEIISDEKNVEQIQEYLYKMATRLSESIGAPDAKSLGNVFLETSKVYMPLSNYDLETDALIYTAGRALEDKGLMPDANTAVKKAHEMVNIILVRFNELPAGRNWTDSLFALVEGGDLIFKKNGGVEVSDAILMYKRFTQYVNKNSKK